MYVRGLPFDHENDEYLRHFITRGWFLLVIKLTFLGGQYHIPNSVPPLARDLIRKMLVVDPTKRITIAEIREHAYFIIDLPRYLTPLPPVPFGQLKSLVNDPKVLDFEMVEGIGRIEEDIVVELAGLIKNTDKEHVFRGLRQKDLKGQSNSVSFCLLIPLILVDQGCLSSFA